MLSVLSVDSNNDLYLSLEESLSFLGHPLEIERIPAWFEAMDSNGDGFIAPHEFDKRLPREGFAGHWGF